MRRILSVLSLTLVLPLAACFDVDMSLSFPDEDNVEMKSVMTASPEFYAMASSDGEDMCENGEGMVQDDGSYICTEVESGSIDELMADPDKAQGMTIERRDGGLLFVALDMGDLTSEMAMPEEEVEDSMKDMLREAFAGHAITVNVAGSEIVETNGTISDDGKTATFEIPLTVLLDNPADVDLPDAFTVLLKPGK